MSVGTEIQTEEPRTAQDIVQSFKDRSAAESPENKPDDSKAGDDQSAAPTVEAGETVATESVTDDVSGDEGGEDDVFTSEILARAQSQGISEDEARAFGSPEVLQHAVSHFSRRMLAAGEAALQQTADAQPQPTQTEPAAPAATAANLPAEGVYKVGLSSEDGEFDPGFVSEMTKMSEHYAGQVQTLREDFQQYIDNLATDNQSRLDQEFDGRLESRFVKSDDKLAEAFGKGATRGVSQDFLKIRQDVKRVMQVTAYGYQQNNVPVPDEDSLYEEALRVVLPKHFEKQALSKAKSEVAKQLQGQDGRFTAQPTSSDATSGMTGEQKSQSMFSKVWAKTGLARR